MKIKCAYHACKKEVAQDKVVKSTLIFNKAGRIVQERREYCSRQCAEYDQMAHEG